MTPATIHQLSPQPAVGAIAGAGDVSDRLHLAMLEFLKQELPDLSYYIEQNAEKIVSSFKELAQQTASHSNQMDHVMALARTIELGGQSIPYEKSVEILYEPLADAIDKILHVSKLAMSMVMTIGNAAENISRVEKCIGEVQQITRQTNMLAMNTQIEAARAGEAGKSFRIIAQEVKQLSESIRGLSQQMQTDVTEVARSVRKSSALVDDLANYDMTENLQLKERIDELIHSIMQQNTHFAEMLSESARSSRQTAEHISSLVMGIQFQDRVSQMIGDLVALLQQVIDHWHRDEDATSADATDIANQLLSKVKLSEMRQKALTCLHQQGAICEFTSAQLMKQSQSTSGLDAGEVDLF